MTLWQGRACLIACAVPICLALTAGVLIAGPFFLLIVSIWLCLSVIVGKKYF